MLSKLRILFPVVLTVLLALSSAQSVSAAVIDQRQELDSGGSITIALARGQEFMPSLSPLTGVDVHIMTANHFGADTITLNIREYSVLPLSGPILSSRTSQSLPDGFSGWLHFDLPTPVAVTPGSKYVIELAEVKMTFGWYVFYGNAYLNGRAISNNNFWDDIDFTFRTYGSTTVGGVVTPTDSLAVLAPYLAAIGLVATAATVYVRKRER
jgi:hypothetical protein